MEKPEPLSEYDMDLWLRCCEEDTQPVAGKVSGNIPTWLSGTLFRNGPGTTKMGTSQFDHVFDGSALIHRFTVKNGTVTYQNRFLNTETLRKNRAANRIVVNEFATKAVPDPCHTIFDRIASIFKFERPVTDNAGVSVHPFGDQIYAMTEVPNMFRIDKETLETLDKKTLLDALIVAHTAHPHIMPNGDVYNVGMQVVKGKPKHVIVKFPFSEKADMFDSVEIVSTVEPKWRYHPAYMHSFCISENYFIILEQPLSISLLYFMRNILTNQPISSSFSWYPDYETYIIVVHRKTGEQKRYRTDTFFFMHTINSFEKDGKLIIDVCTYKDAKIIDAMYVEAIKNWKNIPDYGSWHHTRPKRIEIPLDAPSDSKVPIHMIADVGIEAPRINYEVYNGVPYRYFYGIGSDIADNYAASIIKIDTQTGEAKSWREIGCYPSEPVFIAHPDAKDEDDGVLLSALILSKDDHAVTLIVLNARDMKEIARAEFITKSQAPKCFHGWYMPN